MNENNDEFRMSDTALRRFVNDVFEEYDLRRRRGYATVSLVTLVLCELVIRELKRGEKASEQKPEEER